MPNTLRLESRLIEIPLYRVCVVLLRSAGGSFSSPDITALEKWQGVYKSEDRFRPPLIKAVVRRSYKVMAGSWKETLSGHSKCQPSFRMSREVQNVRLLSWWYRKACVIPQIALIFQGLIWDQLLVTYWTLQHFYLLQLCFNILLSPWAIGVFITLNNGFAMINHIDMNSISY